MSTLKDIGRSSKFNMEKLDIATSQPIVTCKIPNFTGRPKNMGGLNHRVEPEPDRPSQDIYDTYPNQDVLCEVIETHIKDFAKTELRKLASNVTGGMSSWYLHKESEQVKFIADYAIDIASSMSAKANSNMTLHTDECWGVIYKEGDSTKEHNHWPYLWAWVYYAKCSDESACLIFPEAKMSYEPEVGEMIVFPGWLRHYVPVSNEKEKRIILAGNISFRPNVTTTSKLNNKEIGQW